MSDCTSMPESSDSLQRDIVAALQSGLPVARYPYKQIAQQLGIDEQQLLERMQAMQDDGLIRRVGLVPNHYALGYLFNLMVVWDIDDEVVDTVGAAIGDLDFVSHCYRRPRLPGWPYNLFVMVHGKTSDEVDAKIERVREQLGAGYRGHSALKSTKILKKTGLRLGGEGK